MLYMRLTNDWPGWTTLTACCNNPTKDNISRFVDFLSSHFAIESRTLYSLSSGSHASKVVVSKRIPKKSKTVMGSATFSMARGMPKM